MNHTSTTWQVAGLILAVGGLFGATFVLIKIALTSITPITIALLRLSIATVPLVLLVYWKGMRMPRPGRVWGSFTVLGLCNGAIFYLLLNWASQYIEAGLVGILVCTAPIFTALLAHWFTGDERLRPTTIIGVVLGFAGVVVLLGPEMLLRLELVGMRPWGVLAMLGAALCAAIAAVHGRVLRGVPPLITATAQQITGTLAIFPIALIYEDPFLLSPRWQDWLAVGAAAVLGTSLAYILFFRILAMAGATRTILVTYVTPFASLILGALFLGERLSWQAFAALGMLLLSVGLVSGLADGLRLR